MPNILSLIADNPALTEAVREVFKKQFFLKELDTDQSNELIGQHARARIEGLQRVNDAMREIASHKTTENRAVDKSNPAR